MAKAKVIAEAIVVFQVNNEQCMNWRLAQLHSMMILCITMSNIYFMFYLVSISMDLSNAIQMD